MFVFHITNDELFDLRVKFQSDKNKIKWFWSKQPINENQRLNVWVNIKLLYFCCINFIFRCTYLCLMQHPQYISSLADVRSAKLFSSAFLCFTHNLWHNHMWVFPWKLGYKNRYYLCRTFSALIWCFWRQLNFSHSFYLNFQFRQ